MIRGEQIPQELYSQQYSRCALYLSHISFIRTHFAARLGSGVRVIEFGGSNGFLADLFDGADYEIAPNAPEVDVQDLRGYPTDTFDVVILDEILEHVAKPWIAVEQVRRILKPGGRLIVLDLVQHQFEEARNLYADRWLGFKENDLHDWIEEAGFSQSEVRVVAKEVKEPGFETLLATGIKPGG